jgi:hypothetical protein
MMLHSVATLSQSICSCQSSCAAHFERGRSASYLAAVGELDAVDQELDLIFRARASRTTLLRWRFCRRHCAFSGEFGESKAQEKFLVFAEDRRRLMKMKQPKDEDDRNFMLSASASPPISGAPATSSDRVTSSPQVSTRRRTALPASGRDRLSGDSQATVAKKVREQIGRARRCADLSRWDNSRDV